MGFGSPWHWIVTGVVFLVPLAAIIFVVWLSQRNTRAQERIADELERQWRAPDAAAD